MTSKGSGPGVVARRRTEIGVAGLVVVALSTRFLDGTAEAVVSLGAAALVLACWAVAWRTHTDA